jgi:predicted dehydrogenase
MPSDGSPFSDPKTVTAQIEYAKEDIDINSAVTIEFSHDSGQVLASVSIIGNGENVVPSEGYLLSGTDGSLRYTNDTLTVSESEDITYSAEIPSEFNFDSLNERKLQNFIDSIRGSAEPAVPAEVGLEVTALTESIYESAATGSVVEIDTFLDDYDCSSS